MNGVTFTREERRIVILSSVGGMLEFYDFTIYGLFAVYFAYQYFPNDNILISIIYSYSIFVMGYIVRPIGGIIFSHIGDALGRKKVLILTMGLMGISSFGLGLIPTYSHIGITAPILMLVCRLVQGLAIGGEIPSTIVYLCESMPYKRGFSTGIVFAVTCCGLLTGMLINAIINHYLTPTQVATFGWRIPFIIGGFLCFIAYKVRTNLSETKLFSLDNNRVSLPIVELLGSHFGKVLIGVGLVSLMATPITLIIIFMPTYLVKIAKVDAVLTSNAVLNATFISIVAVYIMGTLIHKYSPLRLMYSCNILIVFAAACCYFGIAAKYNLVLSLSIFALSQGFLVPIPPLLLNDLFPQHIRLSGVALSYNISFVIFAGMVPIIITWLIKHNGLIYLTPVLWMLVVAIIGLFSTYKASKYFNTQVQLK